MAQKDLENFIKAKLEQDEELISILESYQNRILAIVNEKKSNTHVIFSFDMLNNPPVKSSDLIIKHIWPINDKLFVEKRYNGLSELVIKIWRNDNCQIYYYCSDKDVDGFINTLTEIKVKAGNKFTRTDFNWLAHYKCVENSAQSDRQIRIQDEIEKRKSDFTIYEPKRIYIATWNVNNCDPKNVFLDKLWSYSTIAPDIYAIGLQEIDLSSQCILTNEQRPDHAWIDVIMKSLPSCKDYMELVTVRLVGMMLTIAIKTSLKSSVKSKAIDYVGTGSVSLGNKGGVGVSLLIDEMEICFVNTHLAAHLNEVEQRNSDYDEINQRMVFTHGCTQRSINDHSLVFWLGDLNYRLTLSKELINCQKDYKYLCQFDQLLAEKKRNRIFVDYSEGEIKFQPTFKYDVGTDTWDSSAKARIPAYCDRILFKGPQIELIKYDSVMDFRHSDHKPVFAVIVAYFKKEDKEKLRKIKDSVMKLITDTENDNRSKLTVDRTDIKFGIIRFNEKVSQQIRVTNDCQQPAKFQFWGKDGRGTPITHSWIKVSPTEAKLEPGSNLTVNVDIFINKQNVKDVLWNTKHTDVLDILVIHTIQSGDIFISIWGKFQPTCFGLPFETLTNLINPVTSYSFRDLKQMGLNQNDNSMKISREIWLLIDYLKKEGLKKESLFTYSRFHSCSPNINVVRDWLDTRENTPFPSTPHVAAEVMLILLEATPEPVVNVNEKQFSVDCENVQSCLAFIGHLKPVNQTLFWYIYLFLREVRKHYIENKMADELIATLFGRILIRTTLPLKKNNMIALACFPLDAAGVTVNKITNCDERRRKFMMTILKNDVSRHANDYLRRNL